MPKTYTPWKSWVVFNKNGIVRMTKTPPSLASGEHSVELELKVPREFFLRPVPRVRVEMPTDVTLDPQLSADWTGQGFTAAEPEEQEGMP